MTGSFLVLGLLLTQVGLKDTLESVRFEGNRSFSAKTLLGVVSSRPNQPADERRLVQDARAVEQFYKENGFVQVEVEHGLRQGRKRPVAVFGIDEGPRTRVGLIRLTGNSGFGTGRLLGVIPVRVGRPVKRGMLEQAEQEVERLYLNSGYPYVKAAGRLEYRDTIAELTVEIEEGPRCHISALLVRGNRTVRTSTALRTAEVKPGELFRQDRLHAAQRRLYATRLFQRVLYYVLPADSSGDTSRARTDSVVVRFDVVEQPYRLFALGAGFETPPVRLLAALGWEHANVLNRGQNLALGVEYSPSFDGDHRVNVDATYRIPYLILTRVDFSTHPFFYWERTDTVLLREYGVESELSRHFLPELSVGFRNRLRLVADTSSGITNAVGFSVQYDTRDDVFDPDHGVYVNPVAEIAGGKVLRGDNDFYRLTGEARWFHSLGFGFVLAARMMAGRVFPYGRTQTMPYYEAFTLGGRNSLRGYAERSLGPDSTGPDTAGGYRFGPMVANANLEVRSPYILNWVGLVGFLDGGEVVNPEAGFGLGAFEYSGGLGLRVRTPIGPVRFDWGKRLRNPPAEDWGKLYLGLLHAF